MCEKVGESVYRRPPGGSWRAEWSPSGGISELQDAPIQDRQADGDEQHAPDIRRLQYFSQEEIAEQDGAWRDEQRYQRGVGGARFSHDAEEQDIGIGG